MCNLDFIQPANDPLVDDHRYVDVIRKGTVVPNYHAFLEMKAGEAPETIMATESDGGSDVADIIAINPHTIKAERKAKWPRLNEERISKAANPSLRKKFVIWAGNTRQKFRETVLRKEEDLLTGAYITLLETYEVILLHEVSRM